MQKGLDFVERLFYNAVTMGAITDNNKNIDMICLHKADGTIIPIKIRLTDEDGVYQEYKIKAYKDLSYKGVPLDQPDASEVHSPGIYPFECKIECFGHQRTIKIFYNSYEHTWKLASR